MKDEVGAMGSPRPLLIQVVPRLKPGRCGLSDHAIALAQELDSAFAVRTAFVVLELARDIRSTLSRHVLRRCGVARCLCFTAPGLVPAQFSYI